MDKTFGFIGTGNMGSALAEAMVKVISGENLLLSNRTMEKAEILAEKLGGRAVSVQNAAQSADFLFLGVKPQMMEALFRQIAPVLAARTDRFVLVSMAAGLTVSDIRAMAGRDYPIIRIMPNTPVCTGEGVILYAAADVTEKELEVFRRGLSAAGLLDELEEALFDAGTAVAGCGPAFADLFAEALADGGVANGLPCDKALTYAAQMLKGAAALILESGEHPAKLKDAVCSPGGATIEGVNALEEHDFHDAVMAAIDAAVCRSKELRG